MMETGDKNLDCGLRVSRVCDGWAKSHSGDSLHVHNIAPPIEYLDIIAKYTLINRYKHATFKLDTQF